MRVIAGSLKGRKLMMKKGAIRPTSDKVRSAIFNILPRDLSEAVVLDLFAGTGAMGIEAISRGALRAVFVDSGRDSARLLARNIEETGVTERARVIHRNAAGALKLLRGYGERFDLVFIDPPYGGGEAEKVMNLIGEPGLLNNGAVVVVEHDASSETASGYGTLELTDRRKYGRTAASFYEIKEAWAK